MDGQDCMVVDHEAGMASRLQVQLMCVSTGQALAEQPTLCWTCQFDQSVSRQLSLMVSDPHSGDMTMPI